MQKESPNREPDTEIRTLKAAVSFLDSPEMKESLPQAFLKNYIHCIHILTNALRTAGMIKLPEKDKDVLRRRIFILPYWYVDEVETMEKCLSGLTVLGTQIATIESQLTNAEDPNDIHHADTDWKSRVQYSLRMKKEGKATLDRLYTVLLEQGKDKLNATIVGLVEQSMSSEEFTALKEEAKKQIA